jgi:predicted anti-sigma-YlaC factor YlaD
MRLDGELSEFEDALLTAHLHRCDACSEYDRAIRGAVLELRSRPLEEPEHPVAVPSRRHTLLRPTALARVAAVVVAAIGLVTVLESQSSKQFSESPAPRVAPSDNGDLDQARELRVAQLGALPSTTTQLGVRGAVLQRSRL